MTKVVKVLLDANVWISDVLTRKKGSSEPTVVQKLVAQVMNYSWGPAQSQLVISHELLDTIHRVLMRQGVESAQADEEIRILELISRLGPLEQVPYLLLSGRDQLAMEDREDAGILATAIASRTDLVVTRNLDDFQTNDHEEKITYSGIKKSGKPSVRVAQWHRRADGVSIIVAHPQDVQNWLDQGLDFTPEILWEAIKPVRSGRKL